VPVGRRSTCLTSAWPKALEPSPTVNVGDEFGPSEWLEIDQERINRFAEATDDPQWIHVDPVRAAEGPFGTTIAHGFLTLSLLVRFWYEVGP
jgi:acyl dehydratase